MLNGKHRKKQAHDKHFDGDVPKSEYEEYVASINQELDELMLIKRQYDESLNTAIYRSPCSSKR
ncbi:hypothetical protein D3C73_1279920 [compost metagenome]